MRLFGHISQMDLLSYPFYISAAVGASAFVGVRLAMSAGSTNADIIAGSAAFCAVTVAMTATGVRALECMRDVLVAREGVKPADPVIEIEESEPMPELRPTPPGFHPLPQATFAQTVRPLRVAPNIRQRVLIPLGQTRAVHVTWTQDQHQFIADRIRQGKYGLPISLAGRGKPFERPEIDHFRRVFVGNRMAELTRTREVILTDEAAAGIVASVPSGPLTR